MGQGTGHRDEGPGARARRTGGQVQGRRRAVGPGRFPVAEAYGTKFPKATAKTTDDADELLAFYDYPRKHWMHCARQTSEARDHRLLSSGRSAREPSLVAAQTDHQVLRKIILMPERG